MHEWQSLSHVRWECKYHVVIIPKYRRRVLYGRLKRQIGSILRELCRQKGVELLEGHCMADHVHLCVSIPPKYRGPHDRVRQGQECGTDSSGPAARATHDGAAFLGHGLLREHGRLG
jgi:REP element-mobilizing transposase RayT